MPSGELLFASTSRMELSNENEAMNCAHGDHAMERTVFMWPHSVDTHVPSRTFQIFTWYGVINAAFRACAHSSRLLVQPMLYGCHNYIGHNYTTTMTSRATDTPGGLCMQACADAWLWADGLIVGPRSKQIVLR